VRSFLKELRRHLQRHIRIFSGPQFHSDKRQAASSKRQAPRPALMMPQLKSKIKIERNNYAKKEKTQI